VKDQHKVDIGALKNLVLEDFNDTRYEGTGDNFIQNRDNSLILQENSCDLKLIESNSYTDEP
jgi:hypothetical protein